MWKKRKDVIEQWMKECDERIVVAVQYENYEYAATQQSYRNGMEQVMVFVDLWLSDKGVVEK